MKPVAILQHEEHMGPGSLQACLLQLAIPMQLIRPDRGQPVPKDVHEFSGIVVLGSERSVLDPVPWVRTELSLARDCLAHDVPMLGLGYGAQVLTMAAGGKIKPSSSPCYGWAPSWLSQDGSALFGTQAQLEVFNAHAHALELPAQARSVLFDKRCLNKGFAVGASLGMLCPLELTATGLQAWCEHRGSKLVQSKGPDVQSRISMLRALPERMGKLNALATQVFTHWALQLPGAPRPMDFKLAA